MELMPRWWIRVQRQLLTHFSAQRQSAAALNASCFNLQVVEPFPESKVPISKGQRNLIEFGQSTSSQSSSILSDKSFLQNQSELPAVIQSQLHGNVQAFGSRLMSSAAIWPLHKTDAVFCQKLEMLQNKARTERDLHASAVIQADAQKAEGATGILKTVGDMIDYCNRCRSKGSHEEALRILETAEQAASQEPELTRQKALGMIQLAKAAVHSDRCDYKGALDVLEELTAHDTDANHSHSSLYSLHNLSVAAKVSAAIIHMTLSQDAECDRMFLSLHLHPEKREHWNNVEELTGVGLALFSKLSVRYPACPFVEEREREVVSGLQRVTHVLFDATPQDPSVERKILNAAIAKLDGILSEASAISGDNHPRVALVLCLLGRVYARFAQLPGQTGMRVLAEAAFKRALQILEAPRVATSGAFAETVNVTRALLAELLRRDPRRVSEADRVAEQVVGESLRQEDFLKLVYLETMTGRMMITKSKKNVKIIDDDQEPSS